MTATNGSHTLTAVARDAAGNTTTSPHVVVTVNNETTAADRLDDGAGRGATVSGTCRVSATPRTTSAWSACSSSSTGANLAPRITASALQVTWNTAGVANGAHTLTAVARDAAGNTTTSASVTVTVNNDVTPPAVSMTAPAAGATVVADGRHRYGDRHRQHRGRGRPVPARRREPRRGSYRGAVHDGLEFHSGGERHRTR